MGPTTGCWWRREQCTRLANDIKAVQLGEQLHEGALDLAVRAGALAEAPAPNRVDLVHEDDAGLVLLQGCRGERVCES